jgi:hypothetical protein
MNFDELDAAINQGLEIARALAQPTLLRCLMCSGAGCPRCLHTGKMTTERAMRLAVKMANNRRTKRDRDGEE